MATTSSTLVAGKIAGKVASQGGNGNNGRIGLKAKVAAGAAILGCAAVLAFGGPQAMDRPAPQAQPVAAPVNTALTQTQSGNGYQEFSPGDISSTTLPVGNVARTQTEAGAGYLEFQPGEGPIVSTGASNPAAGIGLREYLDGELPVAALPLSSPTTQPAPEFGPQP